MAACEPFACGGASQFCVRVGGRAVGSAAGKHWANRLVLSRGRGRGRRVEGDKVSLLGSTGNP